MALNMMILLMVALVWVIDARLQGDVQTEIRVIKEDIKGIKQSEELTKITMTSFIQQVKGVDSRVAEVDSRVTDVVKGIGLDIDTFLFELS